MMDITDKQMRIVPPQRPSRVRPAGMFKRLGAVGCAWLAVCGLPETVSGQDAGQDVALSSDAAYRASDFTVPQTRLRPIGAPSAVDQYRDRTVRAAVESGADNGVRQAVLMKSSDAAAVPPPSLPAGGFAMPPGTGLPAPFETTPSMGPINLPPTNLQDNAPLPRNIGNTGSGGIGTFGSPLPSPPASSTATLNPIIPVNPQPGGSFVPVPRSGAIVGQSGPGGDYAPMPQPQLGNQFATLGNCRNISAPSGYRSDRILTCGQPTSYLTTVGATSPPPIYSPPPAQIGPPVILPPTQMGAPIGSTQTVIPGPAGYRPLISFGQERFPVQIGQGVFGQPVAYVPGQKFRNAIRYITW